MKLKHMIVAGAVSCSFGTLAFAQQEQAQEREGPGILGQEGAQQEQREGGAWQRGETMGQEPGAQGAQASGAERNSQVVKQVQEKLKQEGYQAGPVDGIWGPKTQSAVKQFQESQGLEASGQLDQETLAALDIDSMGAGGEAGEPGAGTGTGILDQEREQQQEQAQEQPQQ